VGGIIFPFPLAMGVDGFSFKTFLKENISFQADIYFKVMITEGGEGYYFTGVAGYSSCVINTNFMYQKKLKEKEYFDMFWFMGGGASLGSTMVGNGKFGANAIMGLEFVFKRNLVFQIDMRPGYGMLFSSGNKLRGTYYHPTTNPWSHFDWLLGCTFRYPFKTKEVEKK
jgi:hypothetical protein